MSPSKVLLLWALSALAPVTSAKKQSPEAVELGSTGDMQKIGRPGWMRNAKARPHPDRSSRSAQISGTGGLEIGANGEEVGSSGAASARSMAKIQVDAGMAVGTGMARTNKATICAADKNHLCPHFAHKCHQDIMDDTYSVKREDCETTCQEEVGCIIPPKQCNCPGQCYVTDTLACYNGWTKAQCLANSGNSWCCPLAVQLSGEGVADTFKGKYSIDGARGFDPAYAHLHDQRPLYYNSYNKVLYYFNQINGWVIATRPIYYTTSGIGELWAEADVACPDGLEFKKFSCATNDECSRRFPVVETTAGPTPAPPICQSDSSADCEGTKDYTPEDCDIPAVRETCKSTCADVPPYCLRTLNPDPRSLRGWPVALECEAVKRWSAKRCKNRCNKNTCHKRCNSYCKNCACNQPRLFELRNASAGADENEDGDEGEAEDKTEDEGEAEDKTDDEGEAED